MMETLGVWLRQAREAKGSTLEQAAVATRIRPRFLETLEAANFAALPGGEMQARGFLRIYARYLGLSADEVLARYDREVHGVDLTTAPATASQAAPEVPVLAANVPADLPPATLPAQAAPESSAPIALSDLRWVRTWRTLVVGGTVLLAVVATLAIGAYFASRVVSKGPGAPAATPGPADTALSPMATEPLPAPTATPAVLADPQDGVTLVLQATEHIWVRVTSDGQTVYAGLLAPEQTYEWSAERVIVVETGNAAGLLLTVNGQRVGVMGDRGEVTSHAWGPTGRVEVPASTVTSAS